MKNKKWLKALAALAVGTVMVGTIGFAACTPDEGDNGGPSGGGGHTHSWSAWTKDDDTTHSRTCANAGCDATASEKKENHTPGTNGVCSKCGYDPNASSGGGDETVDVVTVDIADLGAGNATEGTELKAGSGLKVFGTVAVEANGKKSTYNGETLNATHRYKLTKSPAQSEANGIEVNLAKDATILVYAYTASDAEDRTLALYNSSKEMVGDKQNIGKGVDNMLGVAKFDVTASTTYYIGLGDDGKGVNVYYVAIFYSDFAKAETWSDVGAVSATCDAKGNIAHKKSNYGRYKNGSDAIISYYQTLTDALGGEHSYAQEGNVYPVPTADNTGLAVVKCSKCQHEEEVTLPVLSSSDYTTRPEASQTGTYTYVYKGANITFTAEYVAPKGLEWSTVYELADFSGVTPASSKPSENGVYYTENNVTVESNSLKVTGYNDGTADKTATAYISLKDAITTGQVKISGNVKVDGENGNWTWLQLTNGEGKEIGGFRTVKQASGDKKVVHGCRADAASNTEETSFLVNGKTYYFEVIIDLSINTITFKLGETAENLTVLTGSALNISGEALNNVASGFSAIKLVANKGRTVTLNSVKIEHGV